MMSEDITFQNVVVRLIEAVPELTRIYQHEIEYYGDISNYVFFGAILNEFIQERYELLIREGSDESDVLRRIFEFLEDCVESTDQRIKELVLAGFMESFYPLLINNPQLKTLMKPQSRKLFNKHFAC